MVKVKNTRKIHVSVWKTDLGYEALEGAGFALYKAEDYNDDTEKPKSGAKPVISGKTSAKGLLDLGTLETGNYRLVETGAPAGYNSLETAVRISVTTTDAGAKVAALQSGNDAEVYRKGDEHWVSGQASDTWQIRVWNNPGAELPHTGGTGTMLFYLLGSILALGSAAALLARRHKRTH